MNKRLDYKKQRKPILKRFKTALKRFKNLKMKTYTLK